MSSLRLVGLGFLVCLAVLPAMLLGIVRHHPDAAGVNVTAVGTGGGDGERARSWEGEAKSPGSMSSATNAPEAPSEVRGTPVVELYLPEGDAAEMSAAVHAAVPGAVVLSFGPLHTKTEAGKGIDPFVGVEAGKRRRAYARAIGDGRESVGRVVVASPALIDGPENPTAQWAKERVVIAAGDAPAAELTLKAPRSSAAGAATVWRVEFAGKGRRAESPLTEDAMLNLMLVEPIGGKAGAPLRVVSFKSFRLPAGGAGSVEVSPPAGANPARLVGVLQHGKTMRVLAVTSVELR